MTAATRNVSVLPLNCCTAVRSLVGPPRPYNPHPKPRHRGRAASAAACDRAASTQAERDAWRLHGTCHGQPHVSADEWQHAVVLRVPPGDKCNHNLLAMLCTRSRWNAIDRTYGATDAAALARVAVALRTKGCCTMAGSKLSRCNTARLLQLLAGGSGCGGLSTCNFCCKEVLSSQPPSTLTSSQARTRGFRQAWLEVRVDGSGRCRLLSTAFSCHATLSVARCRSSPTSNVTLRQGFRLSTRRVDVHSSGGADALFRACM